LTPAAAHRHIRNNPPACEFSNAPRLPPILQSSNMNERIEEELREFAEAGRFECVDYFFFWLWLFRCSRRGAQRKFNHVQWTGTAEPAETGLAEVNQAE